MKTMALIGLILAVAASTGFAADTLMTIQTNTTIKIDPVTGQVKGDAQTQVKGIKKEHEPSPTVPTSGTETSSDTASAAATPAAVSTPADQGTSGNTTTAASPVTSATSDAPAAAPTTAPASSTCATCPAAQASNGQQN